MPILLALLGKAIGRSSAPRLHELAGRLCGLEVRYTLEDLEAPGAADFETALVACAQRGCAGVNVTFPFKERAAAQVPLADPVVRRLGAINTVLFGNGEARDGHNTDYSGFLAAYRGRWGTTAPGRVAVIGAGGVGRPIVAALQGLDASEIRVFDIDAARAQRLTDDLGGGAVPVRLCAEVETALADADGVVNATPVGMYRYPGMAVPRSAIGRPRWAFDAVYTPRRTDFLQLAGASGAQIMGGYELFIHQGIDAFRLFTGQQVDEQALRAALADPV